MVVGLATTLGVLSGIAPLPGVMVPDVPGNILSAISDKSFRYVVPTGASGLVSQVGTVVFPQSTASTPSPTNTDLRTSSLRINTTSNIVNTLVGMHYDPVMPFCRGAAPGVGGFFLGFRFAITALQADGIVCVGMNNTVIAGGANPSGSANRVVFGADAGDANITLITVDNTATATKTALQTPITKASMLTGDPNTNGPCVFEALFWALPNAASIHAKLVNKSTGVILHDADISATLPLNTTNLRPTCLASSDLTAGTPAVAHDFIHSWFYY